MAKKKIESSVLKSFAEDSYRQISNEKLRISFKFVGWESEEFFIHGLSKKYYELLFDAFNDIIKELNIALYEENQRLRQENAELMQLLDK